MKSGCLISGPELKNYTSGRKGLNVSVYDETEKNEVALYILINK